MKKIVVIVVSFVSLSCSTTGEVAGGGLTERELTSFQRQSVDRAQVSLAVFQNEDDTVRKRYFCTSSWSVEFKAGWHIDPRFEWEMQVDPKMAADAEASLAEYGKYVYCPKLVKSPGAARRGYEILKRVGPLTETYNWERYQEFRTSFKAYKRGITPAVYKLK